MGASMDDAGDGVYDGGAHEGALELQKLRFIGRLDRLLGVDKFWSEKWLLLLIFAQDLSLFWKYPVVWPWTFWRDMAWLNAFSLDTVSTRAYSLPDCFDCLPNNTDTCELRAEGCFPTLAIPSRTGSVAVLLVGTAAFAAWLLLARAPQRGLLDPSVAVNLERVAYPFLFCFHLPAATRLLFTLCNYRTAVVEQWECSPDAVGVVWAAVGAVFVLGFPAMVGRRIALQSFYSSAAKHSVYVRSRELEYMLAIGTAYRDRRLWLQSSYVRAGRYCPVLYMCQKLLLLLVILLHGVVSERAGQVLMVLGLATYFVPAVLISTGLWRLYRLGSSQCVQLLFLWAAVAMSGLGCLNALGGRVLDDSTLALILGRLAYGTVAVFVLGLLVLFYLTHDFPTLADLRSGRLVHEGPADAAAAKKADAAAASATSARRLHRRHAKHRHLGESLRNLVLEACRAKFERRERKGGGGGGGGGQDNFDRATNCAEVTLAVAAAGFSEEDLVRDLALFLRAPCARDDFAVVAAADADDDVFLDAQGAAARAVRVAVSSESVAAAAVVKEVCGRCCVGGDLLREALGAQAVLDAAVAEEAAAVPADALCSADAEEAGAFFRMFRVAAPAAADEADEAQDGSGYDGEGRGVRASWVVAEQQDAADDAAAAALAPYAGRRVVSVAGVPMPRCDGTQGPGASAAAVARFVESLRWLERAELQVAVAGQEAVDEWATVYSEQDGAAAASGDGGGGCGRRQGEDHEVALMASLMQRRAGADGAVFTAVGRGPAGEVSYWVLPPTSNISFSWPVSKALVEQIEKENATNRFVDVLLDTHALLAEVSFMHRTPELVRVPALVFHARRVARCLQACRSLRVTHHLNAVHPLAPTFEEALELLVHEVRVHQKASLAVGRRADRLPIVSAFLHHRMNERKRYFALASPRAQRVFMKLLVLRMFVQLLDRKPELYPCARRARAGSKRVSVFGGGPPTPQACVTPRAAAADSRTTALRKTSSAPPLPGVRARLSRTASDPGVAAAAAAAEAAAEAEAALRRRAACVEEEEEPAAREGVEAAWWAESAEQVSWARAAGERLALEGGEEEARRVVVEGRWEEWVRVVWQGIEADETLRRRATVREAEEVAPALYETFRETRQLLQMRAGREQRAEAKRARDAADALARWRDAFAAANSRPPTLRDVLADATAAALHEGYTATLKEGQEPELVFPDALPPPPTPPPPPPPPETAETSSSPPPPQPLPQPSQAVVEETSVGSEAPPPPPVAEKKPAKEKKKKGRKAELAAQLNAWKTAYREEHGKDPTKRVLKSDPGVAGVYAEYLQLVGEKQQAQTPPQPPVETPPPPTASSSEQAKDSEEPASFEDMPLAELKAFVKGRVATLNAWKAAYKEERGKEPTKQVLLRSDGIKDVYTSYVQANEVLKARKSKRAEQGGASSPAPPE